MIRGSARGLCGFLILAGGLQLVPAWEGPRAQEEPMSPRGAGGPLLWAARVDVADSSGGILRTVNGTILQEGVVVQTSALSGAATARIRTRSGESWESDAVVSTHPLIGLSLLQIKEPPSAPVAFPESGRYRARMRVSLLNGPGVGPDSLSARIYQNLQVRDFPDLCPIDVAISGAAPAVDSTGRFLGVACTLYGDSEPIGYIVPAGSVKVLTANLNLPRPFSRLARVDRPGFDVDSTAGGLLFRGAVLTRLGRFDLARQILGLAEGRDASLAETPYWTGQAFMGLEQYQQAAEAFQLMAGRDSTNHAAWHMAGVALHQSGDYSGAETMYRRALRVKPDAADTWCNLGMSYLAMDRGQEAEAAWRTSIRLDPRSQGGAAFYNLAMTMKHAGRTAAADSIYRELVKVEPARAERLREALEKGHHD